MKHEFSVHEFFINGVFYKVRCTVEDVEKPYRTCSIQSKHGEPRVAAWKDIAEGETGWEEQLLESCLGLMFAGDKEGEEKARAEIMNWLAETRKEKQ